MSPMLILLAMKSTVFLVVAFVVTMALRRASASIRHLVWTCAFACLLVLPFVQSSAPRWRVTVPSAAAPITAVIADGAPQVTSTPASSRRNFNLLPIWYAGIIIAIGRLVVGLIQLHRLRTTARRASWARFDRPVLLESEHIDVPITFGFLRPAILFPSTASHWPPERLRLVLAHELAHVRRFDCLTQLLAEVACALYWFHPFVWLAASQFRKERECACDDAVLNEGAKSSDYAEHLLDVVRSVNTKGAPVAMAISIHSYDLQERLKAILKPHVNRRAATPKLAAAVALIALCIIVPLATMHAQAPGSTGSLTGSVSDFSGGVVPRAIVTAMGLDTHNQEVAYCRADGTYAFRSLPAGRYLIEVRAPGFKVLQQNQVVASGSDVVFNAQLQLGAVNETVEVVGQKPTTAAAPIAHGIPHRIKVGGNVQPVKLTYKVPPVYPEHAKQNGLQGAVVLQAVISTDGRPLSLEVLSKSVDPELAQAARDAVSQWRYEPTLLNGQPVEVVTTITVNFRLE